MHARFFAMTVCLWALSFPLWLVAPDEALAGWSSCPLSSSVQPFPLLDLANYGVTLVDGGTGDLDGATDGGCDFNLRFCFGSESGDHTPICSANSIDSFKLTAKWGPTKALTDDWAQRLAQDISDTLGGTFKSKSKSEVTFSPPILVDNACVQTTVRLPSDAHINFQRKLMFRSKVRINEGTRKSTRLKLVLRCDPRPADPDAPTDATCLVKHKTCDSVISGASDPPPPAGSPLPPQPTAAPAPGTGRVYYLSPTGRDSNSGTSVSSPWKTFSRAFSASAKVLLPGDTLILLDGTYTNTTTGLPALNCTATGNANSGLSGKPITIKAQNERQAHLAVSGAVSDTFSMDYCSYYNVEGLWASNADIDGTPSWRGSDFRFSRVDHVQIRRCLGTHPNSLYQGQTRNVHVFSVETSTNVLFEENEAYDFHRHAFSAWQSRYITMRRLYANARRPFSSSRESYVLYGTSDSIIENSIAEGNASQFDIIGIESSTDPSGSGGRRNKILGSISYGAGLGFKVGSRLTGGVYRNAKDNLLENVIATEAAAGTGINLRAARSNTVRNATVVSSGAGGLGADDDGGVPSSGSGTCGRENPEGCSVTLENVLSWRNAIDGIAIVDQTSSSMASVNAVSNPDGNFSGQAASCGSPPHVCTGKMTVGPTGMGLSAGQCLAWIPDGSNMQGAGKGGADLGANVLYRYENGVLTNWSLWRNTDGRFLGCGATVAGVNDVPNGSCANLPYRLNINQNGCRFPSRYTGW